MNYPYTVLVMSGEVVVDEGKFFSESAAIKFASEKQDEGFKVRFV